jgi:amino acid transporter
MKELETSPASTGLIRALGPATAVAIVVGCVIGSGIFKKPQSVAEKVHFFGPTALVWMLGGTLAVLGALSLAEVAVIFPKAGGNYVFLREAYGRLAAFLWGWVEFWIIRGASLAALAWIFTESLKDVLTNQAFQDALGLRLGQDSLGLWPRTGITIAVIMSLALVNIRGVRWGGFLHLIITLVKIGSLLGIMALPFVAASLFRAGETSPDTVPAPHPDYLQPIWPTAWSEFDLGKFGAALLGVLWAYHGWMNIAPVAEEVRRPSRNIPLALLGGTAIVIVVYLGANLAYYLTIPRPEMATLTGTPVVTDFSLRLLGPIGAAVASAVVMCSVFGALNGNLLVGPRLLYAMGEDGLAPRALGAVHPRYHTPALAIFVMGVWASVLVLIAAILYSEGKKPIFDVLTDLAMFGSVTFETMAVASIFVIRRKFPDVERPYRCWGYPVVPSLYVLVMALVFVNMFVDPHARQEALMGAGFVGVGALIYFLSPLRRTGSPVEAGLTPERSLS